MKPLHSGVSRFTRAEVSFLDFRGALAELLADALYVFFGVAAFFGVPVGLKEIFMFLRYSFCASGVTSNHVCCTCFIMIVIKKRE